MRDNDIEKCVLCGSNEYETAINFKKGFVCNKCVFDTLLNMIR